MSAAHRHQILSIAQQGLHGQARCDAVGGIAGFVAGTRIATPMGYVAVERLEVGDAVLTAEGGYATILWAGAIRLPGQGAFAPILFETGVMDNIRPLRVGPGHLVRLEGGQAELRFDTGALLAEARRFVDGHGIRIDESQATVTYIHLVLEHHEIILAENVACETLRPGSETAVLIAALGAGGDAVAASVSGPVDLPLSSEAELPDPSEMENGLLRAA